MKKIFSLVFLFVFCCKSCFSQKACEPYRFYITDSIGNNEERIAERLRFVFFKDSLDVYSEGDNLRLLSFQILEKECKWDHDSIISNITFQLLLKERGTEKRPLLHIVSANKSPRYIELLYDGTENRVFIIAKVQ